MDASNQPSSNEMIGDMPIEDKKAFYQQLVELEASIGEDNESESFDHSRQKSRSFSERAKEGNPNRPPASSTTLTSLHLSTTALEQPDTSAAPGKTPAMIEVDPSITARSPIETGHRRMQLSTSFVNETPKGPFSSATANVRRTQTTSTAPTSNTLAQSTRQQALLTLPGSSNQKSSVNKKAKGRGTLPEDEQRLKGLRLFYIPGERTKLRKQRMQRAESHGAFVTKELSEATHVVVDENLTYDDIKTHIDSVLGNGVPTIVTDQWPLECIERKVVFPPTRKYRPKGMPTGEPAGEPVAVSRSGSAVFEAQNGSLELKAPGNKQNRWDYASPVTTQSCASSLPPLDRMKGSSVLDQPGPQQAVVADAASVPSGTQPRRTGGTDCESPQPAPIRDSNSEFADELAQIVHQVREDFKDVPRIGEDDANDHVEVADDSGTEEEREKKRRKKDTAKRAGKQSRGHENFRCHNGGIKDKAAEQENPNAIVISVLKKMAEYYTQTNDHWRPIAYRRAITELEGTTDRKIGTAEEAMELPRFGPRLADKLEEIVNTHSLARLEYALNDPMGKVLALFLGIYGVGKSTADKWIAQGFRTLDDLLRKAKLTDNQRMGIDHYADLNSRIPREEVTQLGDYVKLEAARIDHTVHLLIGGSYRRGADTSGDIDLIITKKGTTSSKDLLPFLDQLVGNLWRKGFLVAELASHSSHKDSGGSKWHGCCLMPRIPGFNDNQDYHPIWRRIDLLLVPETEYGAALIYFTGNDIFNRSLRLLASKKGMRLNQRGLYNDVMRGAGRERLSEGELVEGKDEKRIFEILNVKWREPHERWC